ncbi:deoxycytidylate deaminase-like [Saccostrea cucullata]|uniref:deoxycytidylate deaminase-like n=1 Tax=Saccostrea cuccullata TaxID=36930 RepID=UPI002ED22BA2
MAAHEGDANPRINADISYDEFFMGVACLSAKRSKDQQRKVGACIVNEDKRIVSTGYNGFTDRIRNNDEAFSWSEDKKNLYVCHAEMNAVANRHGTSLKNCTLYVTLFPCNECTKLLLQSGIKRIIYYADDKLQAEKEKYGQRTDRVEIEGKYLASENMLKESGVEILHYEELKGTDGKPLNPAKKIMLNFDEIASQK